MAAGEEYGCVHYKRLSKFVTPCCDKEYYCRFCHNDNEDHMLNKENIKELVCAVCSKRQKVQKECQYCSSVFGKYACLMCKLFDNEDKQQYHCDECGICRIGGKENFFHCQKCNMCLSIGIKDTHKCVENASRTDCPLCIEDIHTSRTPSYVLKCGHMIHRPCYEELFKAGHYACPLCQTSMSNMSKLWAILDEEVSMTPMPPELSNFKVHALCRDCHEVSVVKFHLVGLKCKSCGSYNTCRVNGTTQEETEQGDEERTARPDTVGGEE